MILQMGISNMRLRILFIFAQFFFHFAFADSVRRLSASMDQQQLKKFTIQIQGYSPTQEDDYVAVALKAEPGYVVEFEPAAHADRVHHMLLYGCTAPAYTDRNFWQDGATCGAGNHILYAWARNAPPLKLPEDVAFAIGNQGDPVQYLVLQIHYAKKFVGNVRDYSGVTLHLSQRKPRNLAGVYLFLSGDVIMPGQSAYFTNMSCSYSFDTKLHPFAFRTHTHEMGRVVSAYVKKASSGKWLQIGKRNPQWPQLFQKRETPLLIEKGDFMAGTCRYDSSDKTEPVPMGSMGKNEMCNFYMMYYQDASEPDPFPYGAGCYGNEDSTLVDREYPKEGTTLLPPHPEWEHQAHQMGKSFGVLERQKIKELGGQKLGQVAGLAVDGKGRVVIFHRAGRVWDSNTFDQNNELVDRRPIEGPVILVAETGADGKLKLVEKYGQKSFFLPHGIFVDDSGSLFTTDVGSHQVIKWRTHPNGQLEPIWTLGEKFIPGSDQSHFCKPAGVAVSKLDGAVFVADGYCNNRVVKFSNDGQFLAEFGHSVSDYNVPPPLGAFSLPHDISLDEAGNRIFVADRENGRVQVFALRDGKPLFEVKNSELYPTVYSVHYQPTLGLLFVPGTAAFTQSGQAQEIDVYVVQPNASHPQYALRPQSDFLHRPHVLRAFGQHIWVGEIAESGGVLWHLEIQSSSGAATQTGGNSQQHAEHQMEKPGATMHMGGAGKVPMPEGPFHPGQMLPSLTTAQFALGSTLVLLMVLCSACCAFYLILWKCCCDREEQTLFDKKGFKPLSTVADVEADFSSSDSDDEAEAERRGNEEGNKSRESGF